MRIAIFIETGGPGGAERVVCELAQGFLELGHEVLVITLRDGWLRDNLSTLRIPVQVLASDGALDWRLPFRLAKILRTQRAQVLHTHLLDSAFYGALAARLAKIPHLATEHGDVHHIKGKKFLKVKILLLSLLKTRFTAVSNFTKAHLIRLGVAPQRVSCIGNPVQRFQADSSQRQRVRAELGLPLSPADHWLWLHVANFRPVKDQVTLVKGFAKALAQNPKQTLILVGDGPKRAELEAIIAALTLSKNVRLLGFQQDISRWLNAADGFVLSSISEALPMSLLEAASAGLLLLSSDVGGVRDIITPTVTGLLFPLGDDASLGEIMARASTEIEASKELARRGQEHVKAEFTRERVLAKYLKELNFLTG